MDATPPVLGKTLGPAGRIVPATPSPAPGGIPWSWRASAGVSRQPCDPQSENPIDLTEMIAIAGVGLAQQPAREQGSGDDSGEQTHHLQCHQKRHVRPAAQGHYGD